MANLVSKAESKEEKYISLSQAAWLFPGTPAVSTLWRWGREGVKAASGPRLFLKLHRKGTRLLTTEKDVATFAAALAMADANKYGIVGRVGTETNEL